MNLQVNRFAQALRRLLRKAGYDIVRCGERPDDALYAGYPAESLLGRRFYNVGAGSFFHKYWTNIDYATEHYASVQRPGFVHHDLLSLQPLPVADCSAEIVYTSHTIEHITNDAARTLFNEAHRILKPGGGIRITTPDAVLEYEAYKAGDRSFWYWTDSYSRKGEWEHFYRCPLSHASIPQLFLHHFASQLCEIDADSTAVRKYSDFEISETVDRLPLDQALDFFVSQCKFNPKRPENHINWWSQSKAASFLREAGFSKIYQSGFGQSRFPPLRNLAKFDNTHPKVSMYIEAIK